MKLKDIKLKNLNHYKKFSLILISEDPGVQSKTQKIALFPALGIIFSYSLIIAFFGFLFFSYTPVKGLIFPGTTSLSQTDKTLIKELNDRMIFLSKELEKIKIANEILKSSLPPSQNIKGNIKDGNVYAVVIDFLRKFVFSQKEDLYFREPAIGYISRGFLPDNGHMGIDYVLKTGTPVHAAANGFVLFSDYTSRDGYMIILSHPGNYVSVYKHCSALIKKERDKVLQGELIALSGNSGEITTGPHLHFELWRNGKPIDPQTVLINKKEDK